MRRRLFGGTLAVGLALTVTGLLSATGGMGPILRSLGGDEATLGVGSFASNPGVPFAAGIFSLGVMIMFLSAVVYELVPGKRTK